VLLSDIILILFNCLLFALIHSLLASEKIKSLIKRNFESLFKFYRLFYVIFSIFILLLIYFYSPDPIIIIYNIDYPYDILILSIQIIAVIGIWFSFIKLDFIDFLGIKNILSPTKDTEPNQTLIVAGMYKYCRHPIYFFTIIFLFARPFMDLQLFLFSISATLYFLIGSFYEEKKLINKFGTDYLNYMSKVPRIIPIKILKLKH